MSWLEEQEKEIERTQSDFYMLKLIAKYLALIVDGVGELCVAAKKAQHEVKQEK